MTGKQSEWSNVLVILSMWEHWGKGSRKEVKWKVVWRPVFFQHAKQLSAMWRAPRQWVWAGRCNIKCSSLSFTTSICARPQQPEPSKLTMINLSRTVVKQGSYIEDLMNKTNEIILIGKYGLLPKHMKKL